MSPRLDIPPSSPLSLSQPTAYGESGASEVKGDVLQLESLRRTNRQLEQRLIEVSEEKRRTENELFRHKEALMKVCENYLSHTHTPGLHPGGGGGGALAPPGVGFAPPRLSTSQILNL